MAERLVDELPVAAAPARARGLFRWIGGKRDLVDRVTPLIRDHLEDTRGRLVSLFYGSGAIERVVGGLQLGAEACPDLLHLFDDLKRFGAHMLHAALLEFDSWFPRSHEGYVAAVARTRLSAPMRSARFIWISSMCFNGIWRVNSRGQVNQPEDPSRLSSPSALPPLEAFVSFTQQIAITEFVVGWDTAWKRALQRDLLLADPPYMGKRGFREYTKDRFTDGAQRMLAMRLREHVEHGGGIIAFNSTVAEPLYRWATCELVKRRGRVSCKGDKRDDVDQMLITAGLRGGVE